MSASIPTFEPNEITRGETVEWTKQLRDYPPTDGWTLTTYFRGTGGPGVDVVASNAGSTYSNVMTAAESQTLAAGRYDWQAMVSKGSGVDLERHRIGSGVVTVLTGFTDVEVSTSIDGRSEAEIQLAAVRVALDKVVAKNAQEYQIAGRMKRQHPIADLLALETRLVQRVNAERRAARVKAGLPFFQSVVVRKGPLS